MKIITVTGAESTGKSVLASQLAAHYDATLVSEYSRTFLTNLGRPYQEEDLLTIAKGQLKAEQEYQNGDQLLICDTSLLVMRVWGLYKYGKSDPWIETALKARVCDLYILPHWDIPYEIDPLRENPDDRDVLYNLYLQEISRLKLPYLPVNGNPEERLSQAVSVIDQFLL